MEDEDKDEKAAITPESIPGAFTLDLRGRQSVRATFKLSSGCIDAISIVAVHLGIKQKSLFDHLVEDRHTLRRIARELRDSRQHSQDRVQKTFVISRRSLYSLDEISKHFNTPRDALVEYSVQRLLPIIIKERQKHRKRKEILAEIRQHLGAGEEILNKIKKLLGSDDPLRDKYETVMAVYLNAYRNIESFVEKGKIIEAFDPDTVRQMDCIITLNGER